MKSMVKNKMNYIKENQQIELKDGILTFDKVELNCQLNKKSIIVRNCFTLTGIKPDLSILNSLISEPNAKEHFGYISTAIVEDCGEDCKIVNKGDVLIIPAIYTKFKILSEEDCIKYSKVLMKRVPSNFDRVQMLFYPFYCVALELLGILSSKFKNTVFRLNSVVYKILLLLVAQADLKIVIYGYEEVKQLLLDNDIGLEEIIIVKSEYAFIEAMKKMECIGFCFIQSEKALEEIQVNLGCDCDIYKHDMEELNYLKEPWKSFYIQEEAIRAFGQQKLDFSSLIAQHTHAEYIDQTLYHIKNGTYKDKLIVYDW